jgi:hypothetical protein
MSVSKGSLEALDELPFEPPLLGLIATESEWPFYDNSTTTLFV